MTKFEAYEHYSKYLTQERKDKIDQVLSQRTKYITVVLEDIYQSHNSSAVLRSCEAFGIQDVYVIENRHKFSINKDVDKGGGKWITINKFNSKKKDQDAAQGANTQVCFQALRQSGYKIVATTPHAECTEIDKLSIDTKLALIFGTEQQGLSDYAIKNADCYVKIPMYGFTQSFNISVAAALCMYELTQRLRKSDIDWHLSEQQMLDLKIDWVGRSTNLYRKQKRIFSSIFL